MKHLLCFIGIHEWIYLDKMQVVTFEGSQIKEWISSGYRQCQKCLTMEQYNYDSQGGTYNTLDKQRQTVIVNLWLTGTFQAKKEKKHDNR